MADTRRSIDDWLEIRNVENMTGADAPVYALRYQPTQLALNRRQLLADIQFSMYRFWLSERRMPAAIVVSTQVAQFLTNQAGMHLGSTLQVYGQISDVPLLGRDAFVEDPLFELI